MKRLFVMVNNEIDLNKEWLHLIPEFSLLLHRVWKCEGDSDGRKKLMQHRIFGYIYLTTDFASPHFTWTKEARHIEAIKAMQLKEGDIQEQKVQDAIKKYEEMQHESVPALKALRGLYSAMDKMNEFLETVDFSEVDKQGKPKYTPNSITMYAKNINAAYDAINTMERRVMESLKQEGGNTIRGTATLGGKEGKRKKEWAEGIGPTNTEVQNSIDQAIEDGEDIVPVESVPDFRQMGAYLKKLTSEEEED
jgi:hypothetical protein